MLIPITTDSLVLRDILTRVDGLLLIGGGDIHPSYYGEAPIPELGEVDELRDVYDITLIRVAHDMNIPMFGVCRGEQLMNVALGGSLYQDVLSSGFPSTWGISSQISSVTVIIAYFRPGDNGNRQENFAEIAAVFLEIHSILYRQSLSGTKKAPRCRGVPSLCDYSSIRAMWTVSSWLLSTAVGAPIIRS